MNVKLIITLTAGIALLTMPVQVDAQQTGGGTLSPPSGFQSQAPQAGRDFPDGGYEKTDSKIKGYIEYPHIRQADVMYKRRIWREMDLRQKFNHPYYYPLDEIADRKNLWDVIRTGVSQGTIIAYDINGLDLDDEFTSPIIGEQAIQDALAPGDSVKVYDRATDSFSREWQNVPIESKDIIKYQIKEEWIWDRQRSERVVRIIGIAPILYKQGENGKEDSETPLFWLYYPHCRGWFSEFEVYNLFNDAQRRTYDDLFQKRYFSSYVIKEDNVYDRDVSKYAFGVNAIAESERIQNELFRMEHDMWQY